MDHAQSHKGSHGSPSLTHACHFCTARHMLFGSSGAQMRSGAVSFFPVIHSGQAGSLVLQPGGAPWLRLQRGLKVSFGIPYCFGLCFS